MSGPKTRGCCCLIGEPGCLNFYLCSYYHLTQAILTHSLYQFEENLNQNKAKWCFRLHCTEFCSFLIGKKDKEKTENNIISYMITFLSLCMKKSKGIENVLFRKRKMQTPNSTHAYRTQKFQNSLYITVSSFILQKNV
jgi:hypothetical protein